MKGAHMRVERVRDSEIDLHSDPTRRTSDDLGAYVRSDASLNMTSAFGGVPVSDASRTREQGPPAGDSTNLVVDELTRRVIFLEQREELDDIGILCIVALVRPVKT